MVRDAAVARRVRDFVAARFDTKSHTGLGLTLRLVGFALAVWVFSGLVDAVLDNETIVRMDRVVEAWFHVHSTPTGLTVFDVVTQFGLPVVDAAIAAVALILLYRREYPLLVTWLFANLGGKAIEYVIKNTVHRTRPQYAAEFLHGVSYSFPSGHTMGSTICYLMLAYIVAARPGASRRTRWIVFLIAGALIFAVAFSRVYLGVHYPSDVAGGFAAGMAWLTACGATRHLVTKGRAFSRLQPEE
jgi:membrane-associated phospholipid phosphatase